VIITIYGQGRETCCMIPHRDEAVVEEAARGEAEEEDTGEANPDLAELGD
jgi:hypothetical protein